VLTDLDAFEIFAVHAGWLTFFGHTHVTSVFALAAGGVRVSALRGDTGRLQLDPETRYLINPGSIGQPRDRDPRASYMTYDAARRVVRWYRVPPRPLPGRPRPAPHPRRRVAGDARGPAGRGDVGRAIIGGRRPARPATRRLRGPRRARARARRAPCG